MAGKVGPGENRREGNQTLRTDPSGQAKPANYVDRPGRKRCRAKNLKGVVGYRKAIDRRRRFETLKGRLTAGKSAAPLQLAGKAFGENRVGVKTPERVPRTDDAGNRKASATLKRKTSPRTDGRTSAMCSDPMVAA